MDIETLRKKEKKRANKARGKNKIGNREASNVRQQHEQIRERNKLQYLKDHNQAQKEQGTIKDDLEFLDRVEGAFDPMEESAKK